MAGADYRLCDVCDGKAFYDACLSYEYDGEFDSDQDPPYKVAGQDQSWPVRLSRLGDWAVLCAECAKTHETRIVERQGGE